MGRVALVISGLSLGVLIGIGMFALLDDDPEPVIGPGQPAATPFPRVDHDEPAAAELVKAWERWRTSTFYARGWWERRLDGGGSPLRGAVLTVQDPPRRAVVRLGSLVESVDGSTRSCDAEVDGAVPPACTAASGGIGYDQRVATEMAVVEDYVFGETRIFDVGRGDIEGCYRAENRSLIAAAPWGLWAEFCFDDATGAMESARIRRDTAVDTEVMIEIRADVTEADFELG